jgi:hypothetical protein
VETHGDRVTGAIAAMLEALRRIHDPAHAAEAPQILRHELALSAPVTTQAYAAFVDRLTGFGREATLSDAGLQQVIALRATAGAPLGRLGLPAEHLDLRWYRRAWTA